MTTRASRGAIGYTLVTWTQDTVGPHGEGVGEAAVADGEKEAEKRPILGNQPVWVSPGWKT